MICSIIEIEQGICKQSCTTTIFVFILSDFQSLFCHLLLDYLLVLQQGSFNLTVRHCSALDFILTFYRIDKVDEGMCSRYLQDLS